MSTTILAWCESRSVLELHELIAAGTKRPTLTSPSVDMMLEPDQSRTTCKAGKVLSTGTCPGNYVGGRAGGSVGRRRVAPALGLQ